MKENDPVEAKQTRIYWPLLAVTALLILIGSGMALSLARYPESRGSTPAIYGCLAVLLMIAVMYLPFSKLYPARYIIYLAIILLDLLAVSKSAHVGASRLTAGWLPIIGGFSLNMAYASLLIAIPLAGLFYQYREGGWFEILKICLSALPVLALIYPMFPRAEALVASLSLGSALITAVWMNHFQGGKAKYLIPAGILLLVFILMFIYIVSGEPYLLDRLKLFWSGGHADPYGAGYQMVTAEQWLKSSRLFGPANCMPSIAPSSLLPGATVAYSLPDADGTYVLIGLIAQYGVIPGIIVLLTSAVLICLLYRAAIKARTIYGFYLSLLSSNMLAWRFILGTLINFNLFPTLSIGIPFLSWGGSSVLIDAALTGVVLSVWRYNHMLTEDPLIHPGALKNALLPAGDAVLAFFARAIPFQALADRITQTVWGSIEDEDSGAICFCPACNAEMQRYIQAADICAGLFVCPECDTVVREKGLHSS